MKDLESFAHSFDEVYHMYPAAASAWFFEGVKRFLYGGKEKRLRIGLSESAAIRSIIHQLVIL